MPANPQSRSSEIGLGANETSFSDDQYRIAYPPGYENHGIIQAGHRIVLGKLQEHADCSHRILDIGCGLGATVAYLRKSGLDCFGVDLSSPVIDDSMKPYIATETDCVALDEEFRQTVRTLTLLQVIEHIPEPHEFTNEILEAYSSVDTILITAPARMELWNNDDDYAGHLIRYDLDSLTRYAGSISGFRIEEIGYYLKSLYPILWSMQKLQGKNRSSVCNAPPPGLLGLHTLAGLFFYWEERLLPSGIIGPSISLVLKRR